MDNYTRPYLKLGVSNTTQEITQIETTKFQDNVSTENVMPEQPFSSDSLKENNANIELGQFLKRPLNIATLAWEMSDNPYTNTKYYPFHLYLDHAAIKRKIQNYAYIRGSLTIKVVVNSSPFLYGAAYVSWNPLEDPRNAAITQIAGHEDFSLIPYSQRPGFYVYPHKNQGGEITLPFFWNKNWLDIVTDDDSKNIGCLNITYFTSLLSANGAEASLATLQIIAHFNDDVEFMGPTLAGVLQTKDEYDGFISKPASAISAAAGLLKNVPIIGKFALTTQIGAGAIANIAKIFGFTNAPVMKDIKGIKLMTMPPMASYEQGYAFEKLAGDTKTELSIDPALHHLPSTDELSISYLVQKESYLTQFEWATTDIAETLLEGFVISPAAYDGFNTPVAGDIVTTFNTVNYTPMGFVSQAFTRWRGDIIYKIRVICSPYHKGRLLFSYDPHGDANTNVINTVDLVATYNEILDISETNEIEIRVPYMSDRPWLKVKKETNATLAWPVSSTYTANGAYYNGMISIRVFNELVAPLETSSVTVLLSVRGAENMEFAVPNVEKSESYITTVGTLQTEVCYDIDHITTGEIQSEVTSSVTLGENSNEISNDRYLVNFGEAYYSIRQVLHRMQLVKVLPVKQGTLFRYRYNYSLGIYPALPMYEVNGWTSRNKVLIAGHYAHTGFVPNYISHFASMYAGIRGSVNWTIKPDFTYPALYNLCAYKDQGNETAAYTAKVETGLSNTSSEPITDANMNKVKNGSGGLAVTTENQNSLNINVPMQSAYRFHICDPRQFFTFNNTTDDMGGDTFTVKMEYDPSSLSGSDLTYNNSINFYAGAGVDFQYLFFVNVPTAFITATPSYT